MNPQLPSAGGTYEYVEDTLRQVIPPTQATVRTRGIDARAAALRAKAAPEAPTKPKRKLTAVPDSKQENSDG